MNRLLLFIPAVLFVFSCGQEKKKNPVQEKQEDRKSTRLNSSHLGISYAVFCLKKKKITKKKKIKKKNIINQ